MATYTNIGQGTPHHPDRGWELWIVTVVMVIVSGLVVAGRLFIRLTANTRLGTDDWTIVCALLSGFGLALTECMAVANGYGAHSHDLSHRQAVQARKWFFGAQVTYKLVVMFNKTSVLFLYLRIFPAHLFRRLCHFGNVFVGLSGAAFILATIFQCTPVSYFWDQTAEKHTCISQEPFWLAYTLINILTDVYVLALPIREVWALHLPNKDKIAILGVFFVGCFVTVTSIIRSTTLAESSHGNDATWDPIPATIWSVIEAYTGTICACLPMFKKPLARLFPRLFSPASRRSFQSNDGSKNSYALGSKAGNNSFVPLKLTNHDSARQSRQWPLMKSDSEVTAVKSGQWGRTSSDSDERILQEQGENGIVRTTDIMVTLEKESMTQARPPRSHNRDTVWSGP